MSEYLTIKDGVLTESKKDVVGEVIIPSSIIQIGFYAPQSLEGSQSQRIMVFLNQDSQKLTLKL